MIARAGAARPQAFRSAAMRAIERRRACGQNAARIAPTIGPTNPANNRRKRPMWMVLRLFAFGSSLALLSAGVAAAQTAEQFYKGKTIDFEIGYPTGGSNDAYGRLVASHLGKHIPGSPAVVPRNAPG